MNMNYDGASWVGSGITIDEKDPNDTSSDPASYTNTDTKIQLNKVTGTDILIAYSLVSDGSATLDVDYELGLDNADLGVSGQKSVIIQASTSNDYDITISVPVDLIDDELVEDSDVSTTALDNESFFLQIDQIQDMGIDSSFSTLADNGTFVYGSPSQIEIFINSDDGPPADFTVGDITTTTSSSDTIVSGHWNPVVTGYWNRYNDGLVVRVPIENSSRSNQM